MKWSKLKQRVEANFVPELQGWVQLRKEIFQETEDRMIAIDTFIDQREHLDRHYAIEEQMKVEMFQPGWLFAAACFSFLNMSIDEAIVSDDPLHRLLAILDKRVGKRRLPRIKEQYVEPELLQKFYQLRWDATFRGDA